MVGSAELPGRGMHRRLPAGRGLALRLRLPDGNDAWTRSVYHEIAPPERISYLEHASDASGAITDERPAAFCVITLEVSETGTLLTATLRYETSLDRDRAIRNGVEQGFPSALHQLDDLLERMR